MLASCLNFVEKFKFLEFARKLFFVVYVHDLVCVAMVVEKGMGVQWRDYVAVSRRSPIKI